MYLFGSKALKHWYPEWQSEPHDTDWLSRFIPSNAKPNHEFFWCEPMEYIEKNNLGWIVEPQYLYVIKCSHMAWDLKNNSWFKHMRHIRFMQKKGLKIQKEHQKFYDDLQLHWSKIHGSKDYIDFNKSPDEFFTSTVKRVIPHDELHMHFKLMSIPAYQLIVPNTMTVQPMNILFEYLTHYQKCCTVLEETAVIGFERQMPFANAFKHLVTKLTKGKYNQFCIENAVQFLDGFKEEKLHFNEVTYKLRKEVGYGK